MVLDGGLRPAVEDLDRLRGHRHLIEQARADRARHERGRRERREQELAVGLDARQRGSGRGRRAGACAPPRACRPSRSPSRAAGRSKGVTSLPRSTAASTRTSSGKRRLRQQAGAGLEAAQRDPRRRSAPGSRRRAAAGVASGSRLAGGEPHHPLDDVDAGHLLGDAVLDLDARVDLEEVEGAVARIDDELDGAGRTIARRRAQPHGGVVERRAGSRPTAPAAASPRRPSGCAAAASSRAARARAPARARRRRSAPRRGGPGRRTSRGSCRACLKWLSARRATAANASPSSRLSAHRRMPIPPPPAVLLSMTG